MPACVTPDNPYQKAPPCPTAEGLSGRLVPVTNDPVMQKLSLLDSLDKKLLGEQYRHMYERDMSKPAVFLLGTHEWGNIGDLAINYSEVVFLEKHFAGAAAVYPISRSALGANWQRIRQTIRPHDIIAIHGGGNFGDIWPHEEIARRTIVEAFPMNAIISMPQSIHFDDKDDLAEASRIYNAHPKLLIAVRDDRSYQIAQENFSQAYIVRTEDIVTTYDFPFPFLPTTDNVLFVQRDDKEKRSDSRIDALREAAAEKYPIAISDTTVDGLEFVNTELAAKVVYRKVDELHTARVVVTDRLHGAVFALLSGRPVIVYENSYGKIGGALKNLLPHLQGRVVFADGMDIDTALAELARLYTDDSHAPVPRDLLHGEHMSFGQTLNSFTNVLQRRF